ncbi:MAG: radical SAM/SPASM domain-containing protein [Candidatus Xenobiia bacterium LiM19]
MINITPNSNFRSLCGDSHNTSQTEEYKRYRSAWLEYPQKFHLAEFPLNLDIEITSRCNLRCTFCDKLPLLGKDNMGDMDLHIFKKIIDEGASYKLCAVKLSYRGEPLLHKDVVTMVKYAKDRGILDVYFNTNGMLLSECLSEQLIDSGLDRISISIEGTDPLRFEKERIGAKFDKIKRNVERLYTAREQRGVKHPRIRIQTVTLPYIDLQEYCTYWKAYCDEVAAVDYKDETERQRDLVYNWACPQLWQRMTIEWDGTVLPCNNDDDRLLSPGNIKEKTIFDCWHDPAVERIRALHREGKSHQVEDCNGCPWRTAQIEKLPRT